MARRTTRSSTLLGVETACLLLIGTCWANAAQSVFSSTEEVPVRTSRPNPQGIGPELTWDSSETVFNIVISLHNNPTGDNDPNNNLPGEQQQRYEEILRNFADAICEQSNGAHKLGTVRIFRKGEQSARADIVWNASEWPRAYVNGWRTTGRTIITGDVYPFTPPYDALANPVGAGYTLGHEWGHYTFGIYDEYRGQMADSLAYLPRSGDTPVVPSIMNSQWMAKDGDFLWLNHSTSNNYSANTAQGRIFGKSVWEVLVQPTTQDPRSALDSAEGRRRMRWFQLESVAPTAADNWIRLELPGARATCRDRLQILWVENLEIQLVIDRSGSMVGSPLENAKQASKTLVDVVAEGKTALGVVQFDDSVQQLVPITAIPDPGAGTKAGIKATIDGITPGGATALFDAALLALTNLRAYRLANGTTAAQVVFLLTDGEDNASFARESDVSDAYVAANVPLMTFGYGAIAPTGVLRNLANRTGGLFFSSPTTLAEIQAAFLAATAAVGTSLRVTSGSPMPAPGGAAAQPFQVDSTLASFNVLVNFPGAPSEVTLALVGPGGPVPVAFNCTAAAAETACVAALDEGTVAAQGIGGWSVQATNNTGTSKAVNVDVLGVPKPERSYDLVIGGAAGSEVRYPAPIVLSATPSKGLPITGVNLVAMVIDPARNGTTIDMNDEGRNGDALAGDGTYSAIVGYQSSGVYSVAVDVNNANLAARFTIDGFQPAHPTPDPNGNPPPAPPLAPITENFTRSARTQVTVVGAANDDHANTPPGTPISADNEDAAGRIDFAADEDFFSIGGIDPSRALAVRVAKLAFGMDPVLDVFRSDGVTQVASGTLQTSAGANGYLVLIIPPGSLDRTGSMFARVTHADPGASQGTYALSAGPAIVGDRRAGLDDFKCYVAAGKAEKRTVALADEFESKQTSVRRPVRVCNPADAEADGIRSADARLACFAIRDAKTKPKQPRFRRRTVALQNAFGVNIVTVQRPEALCLPSGKGAPAPSDLDHYKCYRVRGGAAKSTVTLADELESKRTLILKAAVLCNPVDTNGEGVRNAASHLLCYTIRDAKKPKQPKLRKQSVTLVNPFGQQALKLKKSALLCVPSTK